MMPLSWLIRLLLAIPLTAIALWLARDDDRPESEYETFAEHFARRARIMRTVRWAATLIALGIVIGVLAAALLIRG